MTVQPVNVDRALASFDQLWSPRIMARVNDYDVRVAKVKGQHIWHQHDDIDEFFFVLGGALDIDVREADGERTVHLLRGDASVVPRGTQHRPQSSDGASILMFEPTGTPSTGDQHGTIPAHVDSTVGHALDLSS